MDRSQRNPRLFAPLAALSLVALALSGAAQAADAVEEKFEKTYDGTGVARLKLQNVNGPVRVGTWDQANIRVSAVKRAKGSRAEEDLAETQIRVTKQGSTLDVETILPKPSRTWGIFTWGNRTGAEVSYELSLPAGLEVDVETVNGRVSAERRLAPLTLNTVNGSVRVEAHDAPIHVNTVNGSVEVAFAGALQAADLETVNGSVTVSCGRDSSFRYDLQTVNGKIRSDFPDVTVEGKWGPKEARGEVAGGKGRLTVETVNGEVRIVAVDPAAR
ncbi:MAG: DUF4097 family beta strand repeat-containing protein [Thermoanaerobaculia bacterium]